MSTCDCGAPKGQYSLRCVACGQAASAAAGGNLSPEARARHRRACRERYAAKRIRKPEALRMRRDGMTYKAIGRELGVSWATVRNWWMEDDEHGQRS